MPTPGHKANSFSKRLQAPDENSRFSFGNQEQGSQVLALTINQLVK